MPRCTRWGRCCGTAVAAQKHDTCRQSPGASCGLQAFGVTEPTSGTDTLSLRTTAVRDGDTTIVVNGQKIWTSRAEHSDLMLLLGAHDAARTGEEADRGPVRVPGRHARGQGAWPHHPADPHHDEPRHHRGVLRQHARAGGKPDRRGRARASATSSSGMNAERILIAAECIGDAKWFIDKATAYAKERGVFGRPIGQNQGVQFPIARAYAQMRAAELMVHEAAALLRGRPRLRRRSQHGEAARRRRVLGGGRHVRADPRRLRLCRGVRRRAQVPRDAALPGGADLDQSHPRPISPSTCWTCRGRIDRQARRRFVHLAPLAGRGRHPSVSEEVG